MTVFLSFSVTTSMIAGTKVRTPFSDYPILYGSAKLQPQLRNKIEKTVVGCYAGVQVTPGSLSVEEYQT